MTDLIGPGSNATNVVTARPAETRTFGPLDTWFRDCSSPSAGDGTRVPAAFLNMLAALVRQAIRQAGVTEDNADDLMLWKAMQAASAAPTLIVHRGAGAGTANALAATVTPAVTGYVDGDIYEIAPVATSTTTAPTLSVSGLAAKTIVHADGSPLLVGELAAGVPLLFAYRAALGKIVLLGTPKAYIDALVAALLPADAAGWLHNDGAGALAWTTPSAAGAYTYGGIGTAVTMWFDGSSYTVEGDPMGTYSPGATLPALGSTISMDIGGATGTYKLVARSPVTQHASCYLLSYMRVA